MTWDQLAALVREVDFSPAWALGVLAFAYALIRWFLRMIRGAFGDL